MSGKPALEFLDTNVLGYAQDPSAGEKHTTARDLIRGLWETGNGCLSVQVLQEFYVTVTRKVARPLSTEDAAEIVRDPSFWQVHIPHAEDVLGATDIQRHYQVSFWDAMIIHSAKCLGCKVVCSEDLSDGQEYENMLVRNPFKRS